jgi:hypothetical protein
VAFGKTAGLTDKLFKVRDYFESYFDMETGMPYKAIRNVREGGYRAYNEVMFYHEDSLVISQKSGEFKVPPTIVDMVSALYILRNTDISGLQPGDSIQVVTFFDDEIFPFPLRYKGRETVSIKIGTFECHRFDPVVEPGRIFKSDDDMRFWMSADKNKIPIRIEFELIVGAVRIDLVDYKNLKYPLKKKKKN